MTTLCRLFALGALVLSNGLVLAQNRTGSGGWGANSTYNSLYGKGMAAEFKGQVVGIERSAPMKGMDVNVALLVKATNGGTAMVDLGPAWFVDNLPTKVKMKSWVTVRGSKVSVNGSSTTLAQKVVSGNQALYL